MIAFLKKKLERLRLKKLLKSLSKEELDIIYKLYKSEKPLSFRGGNSAINKLAGLGIIKKHVSTNRIPNQATPTPTTSEEVSQ
jgi:hypothetical protein